MRTKDGLALRFRHEKGDWVQYLKRRQETVEVKIERRVVCEVVSGPREAEKVEHEGIAYCSPKDMYDHEIGRQVALYAVLTNLPKGSKLGQELLAAYVSREGALPWCLNRTGHPQPEILVNYRRSRRRAVAATTSVLLQSVLEASVASLESIISNVPSATAAIIEGVKP